MNLETNQYDGEKEIKKNFNLLSFSGLHFIKPDYFKDFEPHKCYVFDLYKEISKKNTVRSKLIKPNFWFDLGTQEQLKEAESWLLSRK